MRENLEKTWGNQIEEFKKIKFDKKEYYKDFFYNWLKKYRAYGNALDEGCGTGFYTIMLDRLGYHTTGIEISPVLLNEAKKNKKRLGCRFSLVKGDIRNMPFKDEYFNVVVSGGIVEHFTETGKALDEIQRVLKKEGLLLIHVPHKIGIFTIIKVMQQVLGIWKIGYEKSFTKWKFKEMLKKRGFMIMDFKIKRINMGKRKIIGKILRILDAPFRVIGLGGQHMFFLCKKI